MSWLKTMTDMIEAENASRAEFMSQLGKPDIILPVPDGDPDYPQSYGYWKISGGILRFTRSGESYWTWDSQVFISTKELATLASLKLYPVRGVAYPKSKG